MQNELSVFSVYLNDLSPVPTVPTVSDDVTSTLQPRRSTPPIRTTAFSITQRPALNITVTAHPAAVDRPDPPPDPSAVSPPPSSRRFCDGAERRGISWPQTHRGATVERPCPRGTRGASAQGVCDYIVCDNIVIVVLTMCNLTISSILQKLN